MSIDYFRQEMRDMIEGYNLKDFIRHKAVAAGIADIIRFKRNYYKIEASVIKKYSLEEKYEIDRVFISFNVFPRKFPFVYRSEITPNSLRKGLDIFKNVAYLVEDIKKPKKETIMSVLR